MFRRAKLWGMALALAVAIVFGVAGTTLAAELNHEVLRLLQAGTDYYETGEYENAQKAFDKLVRLEPNQRTTLAMRERADLAALIEMREVPELADLATQISEIMARAAREQKRQVENAQQLIADLQSEDLTLYGKARPALLGHGPYAVPFVVPLLNPDVDAQQGLRADTIAARVASLLASMHPDATMPLVQVLLHSEDPLIKQRVAETLGAIGDPRAVPALLSVSECPEVLDASRRAAARAAGAIAGQQATAMGAASQYMELAKAYLFEQKDTVGYTYGLSADVWSWDASAEWPDKLTYEQMPGALYYQRMATQMALAGLDADPANGELQALLAASLARRLAACTSLTDDPDVETATRQHAAGCVGELAERVPVVVSMLGAPVVARALELTMAAEDPAASRFLDRAVGEELEATAAEPCEMTAAALSEALQSGDKQVRYNAAINFVKSCPTGGCGPDQQIIAVLKAALQSAAGRTALIAMQDFQTMNELITVVREAGVTTVEVRPDARVMARVLDIVPSIDIVFVSGNVTDSIFADIVELASTDSRTKAAPLYVIVSGAGEPADVASYDQITKVLTADHVRPSVIEPILQEQVLARSRSAMTEEEEQVVLKALEALKAVDPATTSYPVAALEPALLKAIMGYSEEVTEGVVAALRKFGSAESFDALGVIVAGDMPNELKVAACKSIAAVLRRSGDASDELVEILLHALQSDKLPLRKAAASALGAAGLSPQQQLSLLKAQAIIQ